MYLFIYIQYNFVNNLQFSVKCKYQKKVNTKKNNHIDIHEISKQFTKENNKIIIIFQTISTTSQIRLFRDYNTMSHTVAFKERESNRKYPSVCMYKQNIHKYVEMMCCLMKNSNEKCLIKVRK